MSCSEPPKIFLPGVYEFFAGIKEKGTIEFLHDNGSRAALLNIGDHRYRPLRLFGPKDHLIFRLNFNGSVELSELFMYEPINNAGKIGVHLWFTHHQSPQDNSATYIMWAKGTLEKRMKENV